MSGDDYRPLYQELQRRIGPGGDLAPGPEDTFDRLSQGGLWTPERRRMHGAILEEFQARCQGLPRDGHAALLTAGAPGAGKGSAQNNLARWQGEDSDLGRELARAHGVDLSRYVALDPDQFKVALVAHGGAPQLTAEQLSFPGGKRLSPSEMASLLHRESALLQDQFEVWARSEGYNLLYDATLKNLDKNSRLLADLQREGYDKRVVLSVEVPLEQCLAQNAARWEAGRREFDAGRDSYGGRMAPEGMIKDLYARSESGRGYSIGRDNAEKLTEKGLATALITTDRGSFDKAASQASPTRGLTSGEPKAQAPVFKRDDSIVRVAAAGRLRSVDGAASTTGTPTTGPSRPSGSAVSQTPGLPQQPKNPGPHR
ncbi:zeta toxin family protein [Streptomyces sp. RY43-2]|uniref:UDP-N-acetylglucosamine kinase n=1 Tax=Streptomyces macrolidinus TaxID=2952607 RepID=A0ABT0ZC37_9ACTN|nr:zeta toxin family protein [Streptomyces macrolidinus]MCN9241328.1 zeta toxin family protein [Streptomyces macrolidinus]